MLLFSHMQRRCCPGQGRDISNSTPCSNCGGELPGRLRLVLLVVSGQIPPHVRGSALTAASGVRQIKLCVCSLCSWIRHTPTSHVGGKTHFVLLGTISARDSGDSYGFWVAAVFHDFLCFADCLRCVLGAKQDHATTHLDTRASSTCDADEKVNVHARLCQVSRVMCKCRCVGAYVRVVCMFIW